MPLAILYSRAANGLDAPLVTIEVHISKGAVDFHMVGLPEKAVKESRDRVRSAIIQSQFEFPGRKITVNLAPAELPKEGSRFDLAIALGILAASEQIPLTLLPKYEFYGELALSGVIRKVRGILPALLSGQQHSQRQFIIPTPNREEAALVSDADLYHAGHLLEVCAHLMGKSRLSKCQANGMPAVPPPTVDMAEVKGQPHAKRALTLAAAGRHSALLIGPPGCGKTMLANRFTSILPPLTNKEALESAALYSLLANGLQIKPWRVIPFRAPHHTASCTAIVGGGRMPRPGEISLAHNGVLFLDELPEFQRPVLEALREPLEAGTITIARVKQDLTFPANFQFIAAMNPCPCGYAQSRDQMCRCSPDKVQRYNNKISGPLLDRLDMHVNMTKVDPELLLDFKTHATNHQTSAMLGQAVAAARERQVARQGKYNAQLAMSEIEKFCALDPPTQQLLNNVMRKWRLSNRVFFRILKLARTIADLENDEIIKPQHISEALTYRCLDRQQQGIYDQK